jgi:glyoxylase-like metal-dependent hydrolase (beta-lactamase superfamily II)
MSHIHQTLAALFAATFLPLAAFSEVTATRIAEGVYVFNGALATQMALVTDDGVVLVDTTENDELTGQLAAAICSVTDEKVEYLVNTHPHFDHVNGNAHFSKARATIVAHQGTYVSMTTFPPHYCDTLAAPEALPSVSFSDELTIFIGGRSVHLVHPAADHAHTSGDLVVRIPDANIVHVGDLMFCGMYPSVDSREKGCVLGMAAALREVAMTIDEDTLVVCGHGPISNKAEMLLYADMLQDVGSSVARMICQGMTLAEVIAARPTAAWDAKYGHGMMNGDQFVRFVYESSLASRCPAGG